jgi:hypothetical protein
MAPLCPVRWGCRPQCDDPGHHDPRQDLGHANAVRTGAPLARPRATQWVGTLVPPITSRSARHAMIEKMERADSTDPTERKEPTERNEPNEPIEKIEADEPIDPIERTESSEAMDQRDAISSFC